MNRTCHFPSKFRASNNHPKNIFRGPQTCIPVAIEKSKKFNEIGHKEVKRSDISAADVLRRQLEEILARMLSIWVKEIVSLKNFTNKTSGKPNTFISSYKSMLGPIEIAKNKTP